MCGKGNSGDSVNLDQPLEKVNRDSFCWRHFQVETPETCYEIVNLALKILSDLWVSIVEFFTVGIPSLFNRATVINESDENPAQIGQKVLNPTEGPSTTTSAKLKDMSLIEGGGNSGGEVFVRKFLPLFTHMEPDTNVEFPSILALEPEDDRLNTEAKIFTEEQDVFFNRKDLIMNNFLMDWHTHSFQEMQNITGFSKHKTLKSDILALDQRILDRFDLLDASFDLRRRLSAGKDLPPMQELRVQDLESPWEQSGLKIILQTDEEIAAMTFDTIVTLTPRQITILEHRIPLALKPMDCPINISEEEFGNLTLAQLRQVPVKVLDAFIQKIDLKIFPLLEGRQCDGLNISTLSDDQFKNLYNNVNRI